METEINEFFFFFFVHFTFKCLVNIIDLLKHSHIYWTTDNKSKEIQICFRCTQTCTLVRAHTCPLCTLFVLCYYFKSFFAETVQFIRQIWWDTKRKSFSSIRWRDKASDSNNITSQHTAIYLTPSRCESLLTDLLHYTSANSHNNHRTIEFIEFSTLYVRIT